MNIALLFNSDHEKYQCDYGNPIREAVFDTGIVQKSNRQMKISVGDVLLHMYALPDSGNADLAEMVYFGGSWAKLLEEKLRATFGGAVVYAMIFENMTQDIAVQLHAALLVDASYLGLMEVNFANFLHLEFFRNSMVSKYRVEGEVGRMFCSMGGEAERDISELEDLRRAGYVDVEWEDRGAHGTFLDVYDTQEHFQSVEAFRDLIARYLTGGENVASELVMVLEDLNPGLFGALGAATSRVLDAKNTEEVAQAALSGRRYLEQLANVLFPARDEGTDGRKVGVPQYRNRIWAFIKKNTSDEKLCIKWGEEVDRLDSEFNAGLHGNKGKEFILKALVDLAVLTHWILELNPQEVRKPYYAHRGALVEFMREIVEGNSEWE